MRTTVVLLVLIFTATPSSADIEKLKQQGSAVISAWQSGNLIVVTHGANIAALSGQQLAPAETLVLEPGGTPLRIIGRIPPPM